MIEVVGNIWDYNYELVEGKEAKILLPRPGCGYRGLLWEDIKPLIDPILPNNILVISKE
jgi:hypothetical protein